MRIILFVLAILFLGACSSSKAATVDVQTDVNGLHVRGTGTVIYQDDQWTYVLTAGHAIGPSGSLPDWRRVSYYVGFSRSVEKAEYVEHYVGMTADGNVDAGVLRVRGKPEVGVAKLSADGNLFGGQDLVVKTYRVGAETKLDASVDEKRLSTRPDVEPGDSGAAVYAKGRIIGLISGLPTQDDDAIFIRWNALTSWMRSVGLGRLMPAQ